MKLTPIEHNPFDSPADRIARRNGGRIGYADGGEPILRRTAPFPEAPEGYEYYESPSNAGSTSGVAAPPENDIPAQEGVSPGVTAGVGKMIQGVGDWIATPRNLMAGVAQVEPEVPGQWSEEDQYRQNLANAAQSQKEIEFGGQTALNLFGTSAPFVPKGTVGVAGGKPPIVYRGEHTAPDPEIGSPLHNVTTNAYPEDFYGPNVLRYYAPGNEAGMDASTYRKILNFRNKPDELVNIWRAIPADKKPGYSLGKDYINPGDWVTINRQYAVEHGEGALGGKYAIAKARVPAKELFTQGDSFHEWGWHPEAIPKEPAQPFYSAVERAVSALPDQAMTGEQWWNRLWTPESRRLVAPRTPENKLAEGPPKPVTIQGVSPLTNVKPEELDWLGLEDWLKDQKGPVTKQQVLDHIRDNQVQVQEVMKGASPEDMQRYEELKKLSEQRLLTDEESAEWVRIRDATQGEGSRTKFSSFQLPGGENYREMLLTLPPKIKSGVGLTFNDIAERLGYGGWHSGLTDAQKLHIEQVFDSQKMGPVEYNSQIRLREDRIEELRRQMRGTSGTDAIRSEIRSLSNERDALVKQKKETEANNFKSSHWDEPNVLAHVRFNDRVIDGKKTLFVEEVQSDWHQKGREQGYAEDEKPKVENFTDWAEANGYPEAEINAAWNNKDNPIFNEWDKINSEQIDRLRKHLAGVPDAPFKTTWPDLAMKRIIRYAAENGYDKVAWTPGEVQAARYDLSKHIDSVNYNPNNGQLHAYKGGDPVINKVVAPKDLPDVIGKEAADRLLNNPTKKSTIEGPFGIPRTEHELSGIDLKVGGEGMKGFYDQILPAAVNKLVKKYGARVGHGDIGGNQGWYAEGRDGFHGPFSSRDTAIEFVHRNGINAKIRQATEPSKQVHSVDITPSLRKAAMEQGFPQFARGGAVKVAKSSVSYSKGMPSRHCGICEFYRARTCTKVSGDIDPAYWCRLYKRASVKLTRVAHDPFEVHNAIRRATHGHKSSKG